MKKRRDTGIGVPPLRLIGDQESFSLSAMR